VLGRRRFSPLPTAFSDRGVLTFGDRAGVSSLFISLLCVEAMFGG